MTSFRSPAGDAFELDQFSPAIHNVVRSAMIYAGRSKHRETTVVHLISELLDLRQLPNLAAFSQVDFEGLAREASKTLYEQRKYADAPDAPLSKDLRDLLLSAQHHADTLEGGDLNLAGLLWSVLDEIRSNPRHNRLRIAAKIPAQDETFSTSTSNSWLTLLIGSACGAGGLLLYVLGHPSETAEFALPHGLIYRTLGGFLLCATGPILMVRGSVGDSLFDRLPASLQHFPAFMLVCGLIVVPMCVSLLLYGPAPWFADARVVTHRSWSGSLYAFGAYEGLIAAIFSFERTFSFKVIFQKIVAALSAFSVAIALLLEQLGT